MIDAIVLDMVEGLRGRHPELRFMVTESVRTNALEFAVYTADFENLGKDCLYITDLVDRSRLRYASSVIPIFDVLIGRLKDEQLKRSKNGNDTARTAFGRIFHRRRNNSRHQDCSM